MISIIVPIYNVERYIVQCLESLVNLTPVENNDIEIILIDDGSTDKSGKIADDYASHYSNFYVYHTENHGLAAARNYGIDKSRGEWIMFVDSDDWVDPSFCIIPFQISVKYDADLVLFNYFIVNSDNSKHKQRTKSFGSIVSREEAIEYGAVNAWSKLYRRELFDGIRFPEGHVYEDLATTHKVIYKAKRIVIIDDPLVYYNRFRQNSITNTLTKASIRDLLNYSFQRYDFLLEHGYPMKQYEEYHYLNVFSYCILMTPGDEMYMEAERALDQMKAVPNSFTIRMRIMLLIWKINKNLFHFICRLFRKKLSE